MKTINIRLEYWSQIVIRLREILSRHQIRAIFSKIKKTVDANSITLAFNSIGSYKNMSEEDKAFFVILSNFGYQLS